MTINRELLLDQREQRGRLDRLDEITRAKSIRIRSQHRVIETGDDDCRNAYLPGGDQLKTVERAEPDVDDQQVRRVIAQGLPAILEAAGKEDLISCFLEQLFHSIQINLVVVDDQNTSTHAAAPVILGTR